MNHDPTFISNRVQSGDTLVDCELQSTGSPLVPVDEVVELVRKFSVNLRDGSRDVGLVASATSVLDHHGVLCIVVRKRFGWSFNRS